MHFYVVWFLQSMSSQQCIHARLVSNKTISPSVAEFRHISKTKQNWKLSCQTLNWPSEAKRMSHSKSIFNFWFECIFNFWKMFLWPWNRGHPSKGKQKQGQHTQDRTIRKKTEAGSAGRLSRSLGNSPFFWSKQMCVRKSFMWHKTDRQLKARFQEAFPEMLSNAIDQFAFKESGKTRKTFDFSGLVPEFYDKVMNVRVIRSRRANNGTFSRTKNNRFLSDSRLN